MENIKLSIDKAFGFVPKESVAAYELDRKSVV